MFRKKSALELEWEKLQKKEQSAVEKYAAEPYRRSDYEEIDFVCLATDGRQYFATII